MTLSDRYARKLRTAQQATLTAAAALALFSSAPSVSAADAGAPWVEEVVPVLGGLYCTTDVALTADMLLAGDGCWESGGLTRQGAVREFRRDHAQNRWSDTGTVIVASDAHAGGELGRKVLLDGDTLVAGAPASQYFNTAAGQGAAYVFMHSAGGWTETQKLTAPDGHAGDYFGAVAALSGDTLAVTAFHGPREVGPGRVYVYARSGGRFSHLQTLEADNPTVYPFFGNVLGLNRDTLLIGMADVRGPEPRPARSVLVFRRASASGRFERVQELVPADTTTSGGFGVAVALQGDQLLVGAPGAFGEPGAVFDFRRSSSGFVEHTHFIPAKTFARDGVGEAVALDGDMALVGAPNYTTVSDISDGAVTVWVRSGGEWTEETMFRPAGSDLKSYSRFGQDVTLAGNLAVITAGGPIWAFHRAEPRATDAGAAGGTSGAGGTSNSGGSGSASGSAGVDGGTAAAGGAGGAGTTCSGNKCTADDGGKNASGDDSGCGCRVAAGDSARSATWLAVLAALIAGRRRRRE